MTIPAPSATRHLGPGERDQPMTLPTQDMPEFGTGRENSFEIQGPMGGTITIPIAPEPNLPSDATSAAAARDHFAEHGYAVVRGFVPPARCQEIIRVFESEVKKWPGALPRYPTSADEPSRFDAQGRIENGFMGAHRWPHPELGGFTRLIGELLAPDGDVARAASVFMSGPSVLIDSFYFEVNGNTTPHRDIDFLPSAEKIVVMWMAFEDIGAGAGRLYLYPDSHRDHSPAQAHSMVTDDYSQATLETARCYGTPCTAPAVRRGDLIAFNGAIVHGSLETVDRASTRHSLTAHFGPASAVIQR